MYVCASVLSLKPWLESTPVLHFRLSRSICFSDEFGAFTGAGTAGLLI